MELKGQKNRLQRLTNLESHNNLHVFNQRNAKELVMNWILLLVIAITAFSAFFQDSVFFLTPL